jgi:hypothetical protein
LESATATETGTDKPEGINDASNEASKRHKTESDESTPSLDYNIGMKVKACVGCKLQDGDTTVPTGTSGEVISVIAARSSPPLMQVRWLSNGLANAIGVYKLYGLYRTGYHIQKEE